MITHVAILDRNNKVWSLPKPNRHHNVIHLIHQKVGKTEALFLLGEHIQGFVNDQGVFLNRPKAFKEALECDQILPPHNPTNPSDRRGVVNTTLRALFSEDMW